MVAYVIKILSRLAGNAHLRLQISSMAVSTVVYTVTIALLDDGERGLVTAFLAATYLIVGVAFFGSNTMLAHWEKGRYEDRLRLATKTIKPGLTAGALIALIGVVALVSGVKVSDELLILTSLLGLFVFVNTLSEAILAAKTSSYPRVAYWQHYAYFGIFLVSLALLIATGKVGAIEIVGAYLIASIPYLFARWIQLGDRRFRQRNQAEDSHIARISAAKLFVGTFASNMQIRSVSLVMVALYGAEYLGQYLVLWLAFEVIEQLYKYVLLTEIYNTRTALQANTVQPPWSNLKHVLRVGAPCILVVAAIVLHFAPSIIAISGGELTAAVAFLALNYLARLVLDYRLNYLTAVNRIGFASIISLGNTGMAISLVAILPLAIGFSGVALALLIASLTSLLISIRK